MNEMYDLGEDDTWYVDFADLDDDRHHSSQHALHSNGAWGLEEEASSDEEEEQDDDEDWIFEEFEHGDVDEDDWAPLRNDQL